MLPIWPWTPGLKRPLGQSLWVAGTVGHANMSSCARPSQLRHLWTLKVLPADSAARHAAHMHTAGCSPSSWHRWGKSPEDWLVPGLCLSFLYPKRPYFPPPKYFCFGHLAMFIFLKNKSNYSHWSARRSMWTFSLISIWFYIYGSTRILI